MSTAATTPATAAITTATLPATRQQALRLHLSLLRGPDAIHVVVDAAMPRTPGRRVIYAVAPPDRCRAEVHSYFGEQMWIGGACFDLDPKNLQAAQDFLAQAKGLS